MTEKLPFEALSVETLATRLGANEALCAMIGRDTGAWKVREVGDGNLNLVFIVEGASGARGGCSSIMTRSHLSRRHGGACVILHRVIVLCRFARLQPTPILRAGG